MARPLRIEHPGALHHVTVRGNRKKRIFLDDHDRRLFLVIFASVIKTHNWLCHAYCLMGNHLHLTVETPDANLSKGMHDLNGVYTQKFNKRHKTVGHLFQGRFYSRLIDKGTYFLEVIRYTLLNPVKAKMVEKPGDWRWSSYRAMAGLAPVPKWLTTDEVLASFGRSREKAQKAFRKFIAEGKGMDSPCSESSSAILGSLQYEHQVEEWMDRDLSELKEIPRAQRMIGRPTLSELFEKMETRPQRNEMMCFAHERCGYSFSEIARHLKMSSWGVSKIIKNKG